MNSAYDSWYGCANKLVGGHVWGDISSSTCERRPHNTTTHHPYKALAIILKGKVGDIWAMPVESIVNAS